MNTKTIYISGFSSISALGNNIDKVTNAYSNKLTYINTKKTPYLAHLNGSLKSEINYLKLETKQYSNLDNSVLYAIQASREAVKHAQWENNVNFGINFGSSRGATAHFETNYNYFKTHKKAQLLSSPTTTLGNISSWIAQDLQTQGPNISHSITCSTALHSLINGIAWLQAGFCNTFLVGGTEAPLTPFTIAQMQALKIYASNNNSVFPCRALDLDKKNNTMVLGEGAAAFCLETSAKHAKAQILGFGYATEILTHHVSLSANALCFQKSMKMALQSAKINTVDCIVTHTPGTVKGDIAEVEAIKTVFNNNMPALTNNKWKLGHTLGASGALSVEMALLMLQNQVFYPVPFVNILAPKRIETIMINAVGFGGNAVSIIIGKP